MTLALAPKPPYAVPSMTEIAATPRNGLRLVSTFSGCGGSCLGFRMAGYDVLYANEFVDAARATYRANASDATYLDDRDIRDVTGASIRALAGLRPDEEVDVLEGSPPCASFSTAGKRHKHWGKEKAYSDRTQRTDDLFFEYARLVRELRPRAFVAENVSGLVRGVAKGYYREIMAELRGAGYQVASRLLDAQWLGVPQTRLRLIIIGFRDDLALDPSDAFPEPLPYRYSIRDALPWIDSVEQAVGFHGHAFRCADGPSEPVLASRPVRVRTKHGQRSIDEPIPTIQTHGRAGTQSELTLSSTRVVDQMTHDYTPTSDNEAPSIEGYAIGAEWDRLPPGGHSDRYINLMRSHPDKPVPTITAAGGGSTGAAGGVASVTHPSEPRKFTIAELRRLGGFPDDFILTGSYAQQWERIGRAVPPPMMAAVARGVAAVLQEASR